MGRESSHRRVREDDVNFLSQAFRYTRVRGDDVARSRGG